MSQTQKPDTEQAKPKPKPKTCRVCSRKPKKRGLCDAHWDTHRGLADPKKGS